MKEAIGEQFHNRNIFDIEDMNIPVYKYMKLEYVISMIKSKALSISKLSSWEDPYESFFYKSDFLLSGDKTIQGPNIEQIFGQSWTMQEESDAMWRIYSDKDNKDSVRIRTTADKLFKATYVNNYCMASTYIGRVKYVSGAEISRWLNSISPITDIHDFQHLGIQSFFIKRDSFSHEQEIRVIYHTDSFSPDIQTPHKQYPIDPDNFIEEIVFDPRLTPAEYTFKLRTLEKLGFNGEKVKLSNLYYFHPEKILLQL